MKSWRAPIGGGEFFGTRQRRTAHAGHALAARVVDALAGLSAPPGCSPGVAPQAFPVPPPPREPWTTGRADGRRAASAPPGARHAGGGRAPGQRLPPQGGGATPRGTGAGSDRPRLRQRLAAWAQPPQEPLAWAPYGPPAASEGQPFQPDACAAPPRGRRAEGGRAALAQRRPQAWQGCCWGRGAGARGADPWGPGPGGQPARRAGPAGDLPARETYFPHQ